MRLVFEVNVPAVSHQRIGNLVRGHGLAAVATSASAQMVTRGHYAISNKVVYRNYILVRFEYDGVLVGCSVREVSGHSK